jgi:hypothetical protein
MPIHTSAALRLILAPLTNKYFIHSASMAQRQDAVWISVRQLRTSRSCFAVHVTAIWLLISSVTVPHSLVILSVTQVLKLNTSNSLNQTIFGISLDWFWWNLIFYDFSIFCRGNSYVIKMRQE